MILNIFIIEDYFTAAMVGNEVLSTFRNTIKNKNVQQNKAI
jgi:hypothetical protein